MAHAAPQSPLAFRSQSASALGFPGFTTPFVMSRNQYGLRATSNVAQADLAYAFFLLAHVPLGPLMRHWPAVSTVHALATLAVGLWWAISGASSVRVLSVIAYAVGADVLWRMTGASVFWEFGKYCIAAISLAAIATRRRGTSAWPIIYFALLIPSTLLALNAGELNLVRKRLSFNLSGPFALTCTAMLLSTATLSRDDVVKILRAALAPVLAIFTLAALSTLGSAVRFSSNSNSVTSGGFGPNQISASLGLACVIAFLAILLGSNGRTLKTVLISLMVAFAVQCALTMSRGGLVMTAAAFSIAGFQLLPDRRFRSTIFGLAVSLAVLGGFVVIPRLNAFTGGALIERFTDFGTTGRAELLRDDLRTWLENPAFGVGPGMGTAHRELELVAHTEYSRLLAEHGCFGLLAGFVMFAAMMHNFFRQKEPADRALVGALFVWAFLYMAAEGMRNPAPSFLFALAATWRPPIPRFRVNALNGRLARRASPATG